MMIIIRPPPLSSSFFTHSGARGWEEKESKDIGKRVENKVCTQGRMEEAEGEKSVDKYDSEDDKRLIESLELHIGSLTPNGKGETATAVTQGGSPSVDASEEPEGKHLDEGSENVDKGIVSDSSGNSSSNSSEYTDGNEDEESELKDLPPEEDFLKLSNIPTSQSFQALPLICRNSEFIKSTDVDNLNLAYGEEEESYQSLVQYKRKYKKAIADLKFSRLEYDQKLLEVEGSYTDKVSRLEKEMSKLKKKYLHEIDELKRKNEDLQIRLARKVDVNRVERLERDLAASKHLIETLQTQKEVADQMKEYLHSRWVEQQQIVENVEKLIKGPAIQKNS